MIPSATKPESSISATDMDPSLVEDKCHFDGLPDVIFKKIFSFLSERDLGRIARISRTFFSFVNDVGIWKSLYQSVFQYTTPLYHPSQGIFEFREVGQWKSKNPWKSSFKQLHCGVHVRPGYQGDRTGRNLKLFDTLQAAIASRKSRKEETLIFLHAGHYVGEFGITIDNLQIIGAAPGSNIEKQVIIEQSKAIGIIEGAKNSYLGYVTVKFSPDVGSSHRRPSAVEVDNCSPVIDHCALQNSSTMVPALWVRGPGACPKVRHCTISDSHMGILITDQAKGYFECCNIHNNKTAGIFIRQDSSPIVRKNEISGCNLGVSWRGGRGLIEDNIICGYKVAGIQVTGSNPIIRKNKILDGTVGIRVTEKGKGLLEQNEVYRNECGILVDKGSNPTVRRNRIHSGKESGTHRSGVCFVDGRGILEDNEIFNNDGGVEIYGTGSNPRIVRNKIYGCQNMGVFLGDGGKGDLENNEIFDNGFANVCINHSKAVLRRNKIFDGKGIGVHLNNSEGLLEANKIFGNARTAVLISAQSNPILRRNRIFKGKAAGVTIVDGATATLEENVIYSMDCTWRRT